MESPKESLLEKFRAALSRIASLGRSGAMDAEMDEELRSHLAHAIDENLARGMSRKEARNAALRSFGGITQTREAYRTQRGVPVFDQFVRDVRFGCRQLMRAPGFALTAVLTLALGLGATTAIFSIIDALLLRPLPVPHSDELTVLNYRSINDRQNGYSFNVPVFRTIEKGHDLFSNVAAFSQHTLQVRGNSGNVRVQGQVVSGQFFQMLQTPPLLGRWLTPQDDQKGGASSQFGIVISEGFWRSWFNHAPDVIGRKMIIANAPFVVVGVMPHNFFGADPVERPQIYVPLWSEPIVDAPYDNIAAGEHSWWLRVMGRRKPGISAEQADSALKASTKSIYEEAVSDHKWLEDQKDQRLGAEPGTTGFTYLQRFLAKPLKAIFGLCAVMLLLACLNLASLLLARSAARERELATRLAMGASRRRLIQQLLVESLLIAVLGSAAGLMAVPIISGMLTSILLGVNATQTIDTSMDVRIFAFVALTAIVATLLIGFIPAWRATSKNLNEQIKGGSHTVSAHQRTRLLPRILMGLEVALALMLVVGAGLLSASVARLYRTGLGFEPKGVVALSLDMGKQPLDGAALTQWYQAYSEALERQPGVEGVGYASMTPMDGSVWTSTIQSSLSGGDKEMHMDTIGPEFFRTMRVPVLAGREFRWSDTPTSGKKIILNDAAAKVLFPNRNPIGQMVYRDKGDPIEVIAVVGDMHYESIQHAAPPTAYIPMGQDKGHKSSYTAVVRLKGGAAAFAAAARSLASQMSPDIPPPIMISFQDQINNSITSERMMVILAIYFAGCALLVTAIGLYGTLAYATARRTGEIGIRMALGAQRLSVVALVFRENASVAITGSAAGLIAALMASKLLASFLYGTSVRDPWVMSASVLTLMAVACAASLLPALRASRIEPIQALRTE
ncbi:ADOP family duplicated permease [Acidicapsa dinghuensis]|uniref:ADOP family duplicated permease n=1 Tax=Acidicapsa dinghuensis TaxID=2218256 RepID=A0ABW1ELR2_9BACT|nr:ABC transporter permease [Acidicapsa dinghuensis]